MSATSIVRITPPMAVRVFDFKSGQVTSDPWGDIMSNSVRVSLLISSSAMTIMAAGGAAVAQEPGAQPPGATAIPQITVTAPKQAPRRTPAKPAPLPAAVTAAPTAEQVQAAANREVVQRTQTLDQRRDNVIMTKTGADTYELNQRDIENIPQANAIQLSDLVLQYPGVSQDSTSSGDFHIRNEHANVQYRINGILLPDGVSGFSQILESSFIGSMRLITGALPAQYGLHTSGIIDITSKSGAALAGGTVGVYGGSRQTISPYFEYGGVTGQTEYYAAGRYLSTGLGLEIPTPTLNGIHDYSQQGRFFSYTSTLLDPSTRFVTIAGVGESRYQIPNNVGQPLNAGGFTGAGPVTPSNPNGFTGFGINDFNSANINQRQYEKNAYGVAAWQRSVGNVDVQLAYYSRYSDLHFVPDPVGDLLFNNVASDVYRSTFLNGIAGDEAYRLNDAHTLRAGFFAQGEQTRIKNISTVEATDPTGTTAFEPPFNISDGSNLFGWQLGAYVQDEWRLTDQLTFNYGLRFDQIFQYVDANQFSPRASFTYKPWWATVFHVGYMRTFTPPPQVLGRVAQSQLFDNTTQATTVQNIGSIEPERAHVVDAGVVQQLLPQCPTGTSGMPTKAPVAVTNCPSLEVGADIYYKRAKDLLDDGQFGQALALTAFNYANGENYGLELFARFRWGNFTADTSWAFARQHAFGGVASNQSLFGPDELAFIAANTINTDHEQYITGSGRLAYRWTDTHSWWDGTVASATMIYGSGLRSGFANTDHNAPYGQVNLGLSHEFAGWGLNGQPVTVRFDVVNVADTIYEIRDGSGIGVFAPQFGPRRGYYMGVSQKLGGPAYGADFSTKAVASPRAYNWTGAYVGANFGGVFNREDVTTPIGISATDPSGVLGGFQVGYNYQFAPWLLGIEAEFDWTSAQGKANFIDPSAALSVTSDHNWYGTLSGRVGYVMGPLMLYAKGGAAWMNADYRLDVNSGLDGATIISANRTGWNVGTGLEYMLGSRWSAKLEYDYLDFGSSTLGFATPFGNGVTFKTAINEVKAGVNYHLGGI
jgi:opacity protein-like surface antigen/outer membrane receptor protein involved in Fe transport